jgi:hypothetical protein
MFLAIGRALLDTRSTPSAAASGWTRLRVGGAIWSRRARMVKIAFSPPAAPSRWPVADFVALTATPPARLNTA